MYSHKTIAVSWDEFLILFRQQSASILGQLQPRESTLSEAAEGDGELLGLDAKIPGGKFDSNA